MISINYFFEEIDEIDLPKIEFETWLTDICTNYQKKSAQLNFIFCNDEMILSINQSYLSHDYYTDIITFDLSELNSELHADIFISLDTVESNAKELSIKFADELKRVMAHGVLHLIGFNDKTQEDQIAMTKMEDLAVMKMNNVSRETK